jgi:hypothetical protein
MLPSPRHSGLGLRILSCRGDLWVHLRCGPVTRSPSRGWLCSVGFIRFVSFANATQATGALTLAPVGLTPTEHASLRWSHNACKTPTRSSPGVRQPASFQYRRFRCRCPLRQQRDLVRPQTSSEAVCQPASVRCSRLRTCAGPVLMRPERMKTYWREHPIVLSARIDMIQIAVAPAGAAETATSVLRRSTRTVIVRMLTHVDAQRRANPNSRC